MRTRRRPFRSALTAVAAVALLTACGGGGGEDDSAASSSSSPASSSSSAPGSGAPETAPPPPELPAGFCTDAAGILQRLQAGFSNTDPSAAAQGLQQAADEMRALAAPEEIAADWTALADGAERLAGAYAVVDFNDPESRQTFEQDVTEIQQSLLTPGARVEGYLQNECGIPPGGGSSAAPAS